MSSSRPGPTSSRPHASSSSSSRNPGKDGKGQQSASSSSPSNVKKPGYDYAYQAQYQNTLPLPPFAPKLVRPHISPDAPYRYDAAAVAALKTIDVFPPDIELGMPLSLIDMGVFDRELTDPGKGMDFGNPVPESELHESDRALLWHPDGGAALLAPTTAAVFALKKTDVFLRSTQYISSDNKTFGANPAKGGPVESQMGLSVAHLPQQKIDRSPEGQIKAIDRTFTRNFELTRDRKALRHPRKKDVEVAEILDIFPDFQYWTNPYVTNSFGDDPTGRDIGIAIDLGGASAPTDMSAPAKPDDPDVLRIQEAVFKPLRDNEGDFFAMYLPFPQTYEKLRQRREATGEDNQFEFVVNEEFEYYHVRNYTMEMEQKKMSKLAIAIRDEGAFFSIPLGHIKLKRRRAKPQTMGMDQREVAPEKVTIIRRQWRPDELDRKRQTLETMLREDETEAIIDSFKLEEAEVEA